MKKVFMNITSIFLIVSNLFFVSKSELPYVATNKTKEKEIADSVSYEEHTIHIVKSNFLEKETKKNEAAKLENFAKFVAKLEDAPDIHRGKNSKYELGRLFRALSNNILIKNDYK